LPIAVPALGRSVLAADAVSDGTNGSAPRIDAADFFAGAPAPPVAIFCEGSRAGGAAGGSVAIFCDGSRDGATLAGFGGGAIAIRCDGSRMLALIAIGPDGTSASEIGTAGVFSSPNASISNGSASSIAPVAGGGGNGAGRSPVDSAGSGGFSTAGIFSAGTTSLTSPANHADGSIMSPALGICGTCATAATTCGDSLLPESPVAASAFGAFAAVAAGFVAVAVAGFVAATGVGGFGVAGFAIGPGFTVTAGIPSDVALPDGVAAGGSFTAPDGGTFIGAGVGSFRPASLRSSSDGGTTFVGTLSPIPVTDDFCAVTRASGCVADRGGGVLAGGGFGKSDFAATGTASASGLSAVNGASASLPPAAGTLTAGIPVIVPVDDLALRITRPFDHNKSV
jgi:hypothetical protein